MSVGFRETIQLVLKECFWGDYQIEPEEAETLIDKKDKYFCRFIVQRIIYNSPFPSARLKVLFELDHLKNIINELNDSGRIKDRIKLVRSVLFREPRDGYRPWVAR